MVGGIHLPLLAKLVEFGQPFLQVDPVGFRGFAECLLVPNSAAVACRQVVLCEHLGCTWVVIPGFLYGHLTIEGRTHLGRVSTQEGANSGAESSHNVEKLMPLSGAVWLTHKTKAIHPTLARTWASDMIFERAGMVPSEDQRYMEMALAEAAAAAAMGEVPVGAVVVFQGEVIAAAHNRREVDSDPTAHAELIAIRDAAQKLGDWRLEGCTVYVTLEPCAMCAGLMVNSRIERCVYGTGDPRGGFLGTLGDLSQHEILNHRFEVTSGVCAEASAAQLKDFFRRVRAKKAD